MANAIDDLVMVWPGIGGDSILTQDRCTILNQSPTAAHAMFYDKIAEAVTAAGDPAYAPGLPPTTGWHMSKHRSAASLAHAVSRTLAPPALQ